MKLKDDKKKNFRYSMFNPKSTLIISPMNHHFTGKNFSNMMILSSNGDLSNYKEHIELENSNKNNTYSKKITLIDNRDRNYNFKKKNHSFAENVKIFNFLKNRNKTIHQDFPNRNSNKRVRKTLIDFAKEKYYSQRLTFKEYIRFMCSIKSRRRDILIIQQFRKKLLSEEHFFKSHLFICLIIQKIKIDKDDKSDIKELYSEL